MKRSFRAALTAVLCLAAGAVTLSRAVTEAAHQAAAPLHATQTPLLPDDGWASSGPLWPLPASRHRE